MKITMELILILVAVIGSTITSTLWIEERFAKTADLNEHRAEFESHVAYSEERALEDQLWRLQERLAQLQAVPEAQRSPWMKQEINRLQNRIEDVKRKLKRYS